MKFIFFDLPNLYSNPLDTTLQVALTKSIVGWIKICLKASLLAFFF